jgi:hypothetical protein
MAGIISVSVLVSVLKFIPVSVSVKFYSYISVLVLVQILHSISVSISVA